MKKMLYKAGKSLVNNWLSAHLQLPLNPHLTLSGPGGVYLAAVTPD